MGADRARAAARAVVAAARLITGAAAPRAQLARALAVIAGLLLVPGALAAQTSYSRGQNVAPAYEGWEQNPDGSYSLIFGYMNRNWREELDVPVGEDNHFSPGPADRGQPTHFLPRRNRFVFKVPVPADFGDRELVWTLTTHGKTEKAYGSLRPDYVVDNMIIASETGSLGAGTSTPESRANVPPTITLMGEEVRYVTVGQPLTLLARVDDDGLPEVRRRAPAPEDPPGTLRLLSPRQLRPPTRITVGKVNGLHLSWFVYRADGEVSFDPPQVKVWEDTRAGMNSPWAWLWEPPPVPDDGVYEVRVTFDRPGAYVLRARADDGGLFDDHEVTVVVRPVTTPEDGRASGAGRPHGTPAPQD